MFDIETLRLIWWALIGILFMGFAVTDGFDFGAAILMPLISRTDLERRTILNAIGPFWEGNQVWIILAAGALFAAWPFVYAVAFSGAYFAVLLLLLTMGIARPVGIKYRSKLKSTRWRAIWDKVIFCGGLFPSILFGVLVGNVMLGLPFYFDVNLRLFYTDSFFALLNPFSLWCGLTSLMMFVMHGGFYLALKTEAPLRDRAISAARLAAMLLIVLFAIGGWWVAYVINGYVVQGVIDPAGYSNPLHKAVLPALGAWVLNYARYPWSILAPIMGFIGAIAAILLSRIASKMCFLFSGISICGVIATVGVSMFPFILPSSQHFASSLLVWDASSGRFTLLIMLIAVVIFMPLILLYTAWVYRMLRGKVNAADILQNKQSY